MSRIILAEDDEVSAYLARAALENRGHIVGILPDGSRVLEVAATKQPDLLILDASMPNKSGLEALREVRATLGWSLPVLMLTGRTSRDDEALAYKAGADDYLRKPFDPDELAIRVESLLGQHALRMRVS
ncbi:response regulator transcription factor [Sphingomicrobium marinum]|uniref:response regulator transcription factor n=1 Tax=Sphingomicrobium marinum TaxID=1227950 RepID=UPI00223FD535|nr:response regulator transcription factor [Sphingomicrobium marinum]